MINSKHTRRILLIIDGSICSGKTTLKGILKHRLARLENLCIEAPHFYMCHSLCYIALRLMYLFRLKRVDPIVGNYLVTFHLIDSKFFRKVLPMLALLDTFSTPITIVIKCLYALTKCRSKKTVIVVGDELGLTPIAEYISYCHSYGIWNICKLIYRILWSSLLYVLRLFSATIILFIEEPLYSTVNAWALRERVQLADARHFMAKVIVIKLLLSKLANTNLKNVHILTVLCLNPIDCEKRALFQLSMFLRRCLGVR